MMPTTPADCKRIVRSKLVKHHLHTRIVDADFPREAVGRNLTGS